MSTQRLVIDDDHGQFSLAVRDGTLTVGTDPAHAGLVLAQLRIVRIHCEVEVEGPVLVGQGPTAAGAPPHGQQLRPGEALHVGTAHLLLVPGPDAPSPTEAPSAGPPPNAPPEPGPSPAPAGVGKRLVVIDGADLGAAYAIADTGRTIVGNSHRHANIVLHDLYVARVHCELHVEDGRVFVTHNQGRGGTLINGKEITVQELQLGDVLRVGNSHLRFEIGAVEAPAPRAPADDQATIAVAPGEADVKNGPTPPPSGHSLPVAPDPLAQLEGHVVGQYQFGALLGRGLSGLVFRARHRQSNQEVTVKVLSPEFPETDAEAQSFVRALKVVAPLRHPHLVPLYATGKTGRYCWIAREYIEGESVATLVPRFHAEGKLGWKRACRVAVHLGRVFEFLEEHRIAPSRLTPANVLVHRDTRMTRLADVMLDQALRGSRLEEIIREKRQLAELPYSAPELTEPGAVADHRAGLYGLGAVLYALLTGQPPFTGVSPAEIIARVRKEALVKPSKVLRDMPAPFEAAVVKLLARRPDDRFQTAAELLAVVEPIANMHEINLG
jgi:pSer/pThr/pTyr-binding forkhead associated (FHA) protein